MDPQITGVRERTDRKSLSLVYFLKCDSNLQSFVRFVIKLIDIALKVSYR